MKTFNILINNIVWNVEKIQKVKTQKTQKTKEKCFYQKVRCVTVSKFIKEEETSGLLSSLGIKTPLSRIQLVSPLLF